MTRRLTFLLTALLAALLISTTATAVSLVCDPQAGVTHYKISGDALWVSTQLIPAQADGSLMTTVDAIPSGVHNVKVKACQTGLNWPGEVCSDETPFDFTKPSAPGAPANMKLVP